MKDTCVFLKTTDIQKLVQGLAKEIDHAYKAQQEPLVLLCFLKGSVFFFSDLIRYLNIPVVLDFVAIEQAGKFHISKDFKVPIYNRNILIVKEVLNAGKKLLFLKKRIEIQQPKSVSVVTLLDKPSQRQQNLKSDFFGMKIEDRYIFGYGLDYEEQHRHLQDMRFFTQ